MWKGSRIEVSPHSATWVHNRREGGVCIDGKQLRWRFCFEIPLVELREESRVRLPVEHVFPCHCIVSLGHVIGM